jgi:hypothetical protein
MENIKNASLHQILYSFRKCLYTVYDLEKVDTCSNYTNEKKRIFSEDILDVPNWNDLFKILTKALENKSIIRCIQPVII